ncbi:hypothetical protein CC2G_010079 [Coprinopsis cinerea AmutBmut pab1-1]|nr:hypothetical protein CC2G_010079 [Coprinopsis cinerea AmutBmut pab1-1]
MISNADLRNDEVIFKPEYLSEAIAQLLAEIMDIQTMKNDMTAINQLPNEVLCNIFVEYKGSILADQPQHPSAWTLITSVCLRWRNACINHPPLWSDIAPCRDPLALTRAKLKRSKGTLLSIESLQPKILTRAAEQLLAFAVCQTERLVFLKLRNRPEY